MSTTMALDKSTRSFEENTCSARAEVSSVFILQSPAMFSKAVVQGPTCSANVGVETFGTWDAVHHSLPAIGWYCFLGCTSSSLRVLKGRKVTWMARGLRPYERICRIYWCRGESQIYGSYGHAESADQAVGRCACVWYPWVCDSPLHWWIVRMC